MAEQQEVTGYKIAVRTQQSLQILQIICKAAAQDVCFRSLRGAGLLFFNIGSILFFPALQSVRLL
ncbi:hypothetical protein AWJ19_00685 [Paenibacillus sp. DMB5]|nr:hypothetical protein AWJ19_00685 [Paenibacillus sp. DMB5]